MGPLSDTLDSGAKMGTFIFRVPEPLTVRSLKKEAFLTEKLGSGGRI
jgi:hypothetical protein